MVKEDAKSVDRDERGLLRVIRFSSAFSLGLMAALFFSVKQVTPDLRCELSVGSGIAFMVGAIFSWLFWRAVFKEEKTGKRAERRNRRVWFATLSVLLSLATAAAFVLALKGVGKDRLGEMIQGTCLAVFALAGVSLLLWRVARFLESDSKRTPDPDPKPDQKSRA